MTLAKLSLAALLATAAFTPALANDDGTPLGAYLQSISSPAQPAAVKVIEGRQATPTPAPLTDAERYLITR